MPTLKPRYIITLEPDEAAILERYAKVLGMRPSRVIKNLIEQGMGHLSGTVDMLEQLANVTTSANKQANERIKEGVIESLEGLTEQGEDFLTSVRSVVASVVDDEGLVLEKDTLNKGVNKGVRLNENPPITKKPYLFSAVDNTKKEKT